VSHCPGSASMFSKRSRVTLPNEVGVKVLAATEPFSVGSFEQAKRKKAQIKQKIRNKADAENMLFSYDFLKLAVFL